MQKESVKSSPSHHQVNLRATLGDPQIGSSEKQLEETFIKEA